MISKSSTISRRSFNAGALALSLTACARRQNISKDADVVIIGAGLAGLFAAMRLQEEGFTTIVLEASSRVGGRMWTLDDLPGAPEAGGQQVGQSYARLRYAAEKTGIRIVDNTLPRLGRTLAIGDQLIAPADWATSPLNPFPDQFRRAAPDSVLFAAAAPENSFDWSGDWRTPEAFAKDIAAEAYLRNLGFDDQSLSLINIALNANDLSTYSMLNVWRTLQLFTSDSSVGPSGDVEGGSQRLPEAMAALLGDTVALNSPVLGVENIGNGVAITTGTKTFHGDFCIVALPFPALSKVAINPNPTGAQAAAISGLPYTQILQLHIAPESPFWESDGLSATMWTDSPIERIFENRNSEGETESLIAWINGENARKLATETDETLEKIAKAEFLRLRPASNGNVRLLKAIRWTDQASYAGGAYMHWAPGQAEQWAEPMLAPINRIQFAGEHLSYLHTGMEGALESADRAARNIADQSQG